VKLGSRQVDEAAKNLLVLKERIDTSQIDSPSFLMIITGTEFAYQRKDGVMVVPLGCLRPWPSLVIKVGKMPTTRERLLISLFKRSSVLVEEIFLQSILSE